MIANGRPRYWVDTYDRWHLLLPAALVILLVVLAALPKPPPALRPRTAAPVLQASPTPLTPLAQTVIHAPYQGAVLLAERLGDLQGTAEPGSIVRLYLGQKLLGEGRTDAQGRFRFGLTNFPAGQHRLRAEAWVGARSVASREVFVTVKADPKPQGKPASRKSSNR